MKSCHLAVISFIALMTFAVVVFIVKEKPSKSFVTSISKQTASEFPANRPVKNTPTPPPVAVGVPPSSVGNAPSVANTPYVGNTSTTEEAPLVKEDRSPAYIAALKSKVDAETVRYEFVLKELNACYASVQKDRFNAPLFAQRAKDEVAPLLAKEDRIQKELQKSLKEYIYLTGKSKHF